MTILVALGLVTALAAAARGAWSPCGLSMLSALNPMSERGRGNRFAITLAWHVVGAVLGGVVLGAVCAGLAALVDTMHPAPAVRLWVVLVAGAITLGSDARLPGLALPDHPRQVNVDWLTRYRRWIYAAGFGVELGLGFATYIMTAATYLTAVLAAMTGSPAAALLIGTVFGAARGLTLLLNARATTPARLHALHRRLDELGPAALRAAMLAQAVVIVAVAATLLTILAMIVSAGMIVSMFLRRRRAPRHILVPALVLAVTLGSAAGLRTARAATTVLSSRAEVVHAAARYATSRGYHVGVAVYDRKTGRTYAAGDARGAFASESVVKVFIATRLLVSGRMHGRTEGMAYKMIVRSDDTMASALYGRVGGDGLIDWVKRRYRVPHLGSRPPYPGWWGSTRITAVGLVRLYAKLARDRTVAPWLLNAMHHAKRYGSDGTYQFFGLPSATSQAAIKQGWGCDFHPAECEQADFNSTGYVNGDRYAVALLAHGPIRDYGGPISRMLTGMARQLLPGGRFPPPPPKVLSLSRKRVRAIGGSTITVHGRDFRHVLWVGFGAHRSHRFSVLSSHALRVRVPHHGAGMVRVRVTTTYGRSPLSRQKLQYTDPPTVGLLSRRYERVSGGDRLTVHGHHFADVRSVRFGGVPGSHVRVQSPTELSVVVPRHDAGPITVRVLTDYGGSMTRRHNLRYVGRPQLSAISPTQVDTSGGSVTLTGGQFYLVRSVLFDGQPGPAPQVLSGGRLTVVAPPHPAGDVSVRVVTAFGTSAPRTLTYTASSSSVPARRH